MPAVNSAGCALTVGDRSRVSSPSSVTGDSETAQTNAHHDEAGGFGDGGTVDSKSLHIGETKRADHSARSSRRIDVQQLIRVGIRAIPSVRVGVEGKCQWAR